MPITEKMQRIFSGKFTNNHQMGLLCNENNFMGHLERMQKIVQHPEVDI